MQLLPKTFAALVVVLVATSAARSQSAPHWIWPSENPPQTSCRLEKSLSLDQRPLRATLRLAADFCTAEFQINGRPVLHIEPYSPTVDVDVTTALVIGQNRISIVATPVPGPAAVALSLTIADPQGKRIEVVSDATWTAQNNSASSMTTSYGLVASELWGLGRRPATVDAFDNYEQWRQATGAKATDPSSFWTPPGFEISLIRAASEDEGSWISMAFDRQGRLTISREDKGLLRLTLNYRGGEAREGEAPAEPATVQRTETIDSTLEECRGLIYAHGALYASANNNKALYRLRARDGGDQFDDVKLLREFRGNVGHGRNDIALGPDGKIYMICGDSVDLPTEDIVDYTSPFREARRGKTSREGFLVRTDPEGSKWELIAAGLRNPYGVAFNARGDLFTYDADAEFDMGSPWYRPTRVNQLVSGADYGWRGVTGKWPPYFPDHADNAPPTLDIGRGSPTAVLFGEQTNFPDDYRRALFILDWAYGRVIAVPLAPRGAGYRSWAETFVKGRPLNVTDIAAGPDGAMYLITGGRKTQSALYRIRRLGSAHQNNPLSPHEKASQSHADQARQLRLKLENLHRPSGPSAVEQAWPHLSSSDPLIRHAARIAIEHQPPGHWQDRALIEDEPIAALTSLLALARSGEKAPISRIASRLAKFDPQKLSLSQSLALLQCYHLCLDHWPDGGPSPRDAILKQLNDLFPHPFASYFHSSREGTGALLHRDLARLLARLEAPALVPRVADSLLLSNAQEDRLHGLFVLRNIRTGWTSEARRAYFTALNEASTVVGGEGMPRFLSQIREEALKTLTDTEREQLADLLMPQPGREEPLPPPRPLVRRWTLADYEAELSGSNVGGNRERGAAVFKNALCSRCHRAGASGPAVGPDLTSLAGRFSRRDMLQAIVDPNIVVAENYRNVQIMTHDGRQLVGRLAIEGDFRSEKLRIVTDPLRPSETVEISKHDIEQYRETETSPMPQGLLDSFTKQEVLDLLTFLESPK